jgi:2-polyprenyl-6-methoxyphenol hydroxylase-like FAD-dependent oxidoreductase
MGTTLGLNGAYILAGELLRHPNDLSIAFAKYEEKMRPLVDRAQKLAPGMPHAMHPKTSWGVWTMNYLVFLLCWTKVVNLLFMFAGPPATAIQVEEYGFEQPPE